MFRFLEFLPRMIGSVLGAMLGAMLGFLAGAIPALMIGPVAKLFLGWLFPSWDSGDTLSSVGMWYAAICAAICGMVGAIVGYDKGASVPHDKGGRETKGGFKKWWRGQIRVAFLAFSIVFVLPWLFAIFAFAGIRMEGSDIGPFQPPFEIGHLGKWGMFVALCMMLHAFRKSMPDAAFDEKERENSRFGRESEFSWRWILAGMAFILAIAFFMGGVQHEKMKAHTITYSIFSGGPHCAYAVFEEDYWRCYGPSGFGPYHEYPVWSGKWEEPFYHLRRAYDNTPEVLRECYDREADSGDLAATWWCEQYRPEYPSEPDPNSETETPVEIEGSGAAQEEK